MKFVSRLCRATLVRRYKRFLADVVLEDGQELTAHVPNPGAMLGLNTPGLACWLSESPSKTRKLPFTLEMVEADGGLVGVNTLHPNRLVAEALAAERLPELTGYQTVRPEVGYGVGSRIDFLLTDPDRPPCYLEVKNCHFSREPGLAEFPDCVAARSAKQLRELETVVAEHAARAVVLFVIQREDCHAFRACADLDPVFTAALDHAADSGVEVLAYACAMSIEGIEIARPLPWARTT
ncbi:MAG: DNA/RNA nuclease SfsA [Caulobacteraceae bacterium]